MTTPTGAELDALVARLIPIIPDAPHAKLRSDAADAITALRSEVSAEREKVAELIAAMPDEIELYRIMRQCAGRRRIDYARAIVAAITPPAMVASTTLPPPKVGAARGANDTAKTQDTEN